MGQYLGYSPFSILSSVFSTLSPHSMTPPTLILGLLPGFAWLFFYLQEDPHPEPKRLIALTFVMGMASAIAAFIAEVGLGFVSALFNVHSASLLPLGTFALIEELAKFGAAYLAVHKQPAFDEPIDAVIYTVVAALGFATVENLGAITGTGSQAALIASAFETASFRFVGATLLHTLTSGLVGYYWARAIRNFGAWNYIALGLAIAAILHTIFNYLILTYGVFMYAVAFVTILGFIAFHEFETLRGETI